MLRKWILAAAMLVLPTYAIAQSGGVRAGEPLSGVRSGMPLSGVRGQAAGGTGAGGGQNDIPVPLGGAPGIPLNGAPVAPLNGAPGVPLTGAPAFPQTGR